MRAGSTPAALVSAGSCNSITGSTPPGSKSTTATCGSTIAIGRADADPHEEFLANGRARQRTAVGVEELVDDLDPLVQLRGRRIPIEARFVDDVVGGERSCLSRTRSRAAVCGIGTFGMAPPAASAHARTVLADFA